MSDHVETLLGELARDLRVPQPGPELTSAVLARVAVPPRRRTRVRWVVAVAVALLLSGLALSPVGAKVAEWLDFHGVMVRDQEPGLSGTPAVPSATAGASMRATFDPLVPAALGAPDDTSVSTDGRVVSMSWSRGGGTLRLDQFDAELDPLLWKTSPDVVLVEVDGRDALWFPSPHAVVVTPDGGDPETHPPRLAARTLVVSQGDLTVRLEGDLSRERAVRIVASLE